MISKEQLRAQTDSRRKSLEDRAEKVEKKDLLNKMKRVMKVSDKIFKESNDLNKEHVKQFKNWKVNKPKFFDNQVICYMLAGGVAVVSSSLFELGQTVQLIMNLIMIPYALWFIYYMYKRDKTYTITDSLLAHGKKSLPRMKELNIRSKRLSEYAERLNANALVNFKPDMPMFGTKLLMFKKNVKSIIMSFIAPLMLFASPNKQETAERLLGVVERDELEIEQWITKKVNNVLDQYEAKIVEKEREKNNDA